MSLRRFRPRPDRYVVAVQLRLQTDGFSYEKWNATQHCRPGDWLVDNGDDVYTVAADSFARTYRELRRGHYVKITPVWAEPAREDGSVATKEGRTHYRQGDWLVSNDPDGTDAYAIGAQRFEQLYEPDEGQ